VFLFKSSSAFTARNLAQGLAWQFSTARSVFERTKLPGHFGIDLSGIATINVRVVGVADIDPTRSRLFEYSLHLIENVAKFVDVRCDR
jgi:hypothetical protein